MLKYNIEKQINNKTIVGFNTGHHGGCAVIHNGNIISISEERLTRKKYTDGYINSFFYCLNALNLKINDIDLFVSSSYHTPLSDDFQGEFSALGISKNKFISIDHHLSHAYSSFFLSPFSEAIIIICDGIGNNRDTESYYIATERRIKKVGGNNVNRSVQKGIGRAYEVFTNYCGWSAQEAGKTMGLSPFGNEMNKKIELFKINKNLQIESFIKDKYIDGATRFVKNNKLDFGPPGSGFSNKHAAYFIQDRTEKIILELVQKLHQKYKINNVCLGGGVFLNSIINKKILDSTSVENIFIPPCCDDTGQPLGNALFGYFNIYGNKKNVPMLHASLGKNYNNKEILDVLQKKQNIFPLPYRTKACRIKYTKTSNIAKTTASLLAKGKIIAWFQGGSEIGPRALGNRSILCAPYPISMKTFLNKRVKHREQFRPFAPSVLEEYCNEYFDIDVNSPFMLLIASVKKNAKMKIPAVLHVDNTSRIQTVSSINGVYHKLIKEFYRITNIPVILNTSFNDNNEPIVESPRDALNMFCLVDLDYLVIDNYIISKA